MRRAEYEESKMDSGMRITSGLDERRVIKVKYGFERSI